VSLTGPVNLFAAQLNGEGFGASEEGGQTSFAFQASASAAMPLQLTVLGFAGNATDPEFGGSSGSYRGTITAQAIAPIPEPETYAFMLGGLAAIGALTRGRARRAAAGAT
jgi:hypothetical protein